MLKAHDNERTTRVAEQTVPPPLVLPGFATHGEASALRQALERLIATPQNKSRHSERRWEAPLSSARSFLNRDALATVFAVRARVLHTALSLGPPDGRLFHEFTLLAANYRDDRHVLHADSKRFDPKSASWVPNHTPQRTASALLYLSDHGPDFTGGALIFPQHGRKVLPAAGLLVAFPSDERYLHGVTPVASGCRLSIALWMTDNPRNAERIVEA